MSCNDGYTPIDPCNPCSQQPDCEVPSYDTSGCLYPQSSDCISYDTDIPCLGFTKGPLTSWIQKISAYALSIFSRVSSNSLVVTRTGACNDNLRIEVAPSADSNNLFTLGGDGKPFVPKTDVVIHDAQYITWAKTTIGNVIHYTPTIDIQSLADAVCTICADAVEACDPPAGLAVDSILHNHGTEPSITVDVQSTLTWTSVPGVVYNVYLDNTLLQAGATTPFVKDSLTPNTTYTFKVVGSCPQGGSGETQIVFQTPLENACGAPTNLTVS